MPDPRPLASVAGLVLGLALAGSIGAKAQGLATGERWTLDGTASTLQFQSIKNQSKIETSSFASLSGEVLPDGQATLRILLDSIDTKIDLRNVRMRFLFFETFQYPEATISARFDPAEIADLGTTRRKSLTLPFDLQLHAVTNSLEAKVGVTQIQDDLVLVSSVEPINISVADFNLLGGLQKLEEAAGVSIVPSTTVSFDLMFRRGSGEPTGTSVAAVAETAAPAAAALEEKGDFSAEACIGRFEILSRTGNIYFAPGSSVLDAASSPLLDSLTDIVVRCPGMTIQVAGHTDSIGGSAANQRLSERRAASVVEYLASKGVERSRMIPVGFGEDMPVADNATGEGRSRNRRIEFGVVGN